MTSIRLPQPLTRHLALGSLPGLIILVYLLTAVGVWLGLWGDQWAELGDLAWAAPSADHWLGSNRLGQDVFQRTIAATATAFEVGLVVAVSSVFLGVILGAVAGFFAHGWVDEFLLWVKGTLDAVPFYLLVGAVAFAFGNYGWSMHLAMIATFWVPTARVIRAETLRIRTLGFIEAARASGLTSSRIVRLHIVPHLKHLALVQATLVFVSAIKVEVVLSFLGIGLSDSISWGIMLSEAGQDILVGHHMNLVVASVSLFGLVMAINLFSDQIQGAFDPRVARHVAPRHV